MSRRPPDVDLTRLQGTPRVKVALKPRGSNADDASDAIFLASGYGLIPDPWQVEIIESWMLRRRSDGKWVHKSCGLAVPRQNGKNGAVEVRELFGLIILGEYILHTAHELKTSRKAFKRLKHFFGERRDDPSAKFPELNALVAEVRNTNGQEAIQLKDLWLVDGELRRSVGRPEGRHAELIARGGLIEFGTRTGGGARGTTYDLLVVDESQHLSEEDLAAIRPTISAGALGNSQIIYLGTPPDPEKLSAGFGEAFTRIRANVGKTKAQCWVEYGAPDGPRPDLEDLELLYAANPSLGVIHGNGSHGLDFEIIDGERSELDPDDYARERLGWWGNPEAKSHRGVIDMDQWRELKIKSDELPARGLIVIDVAPDLAWTTVAIATDGPDGKPLGLIDRHEGTGWVIKWDPRKKVASGRIPQLVADLSKVLEIGLTPTAWMFYDKLLAAQSAGALKVDKDQIKKLSPSDVGQACMATQKMIIDGEAAHLDQAELTTAARVAITKLSGETQQWDRKTNKVDISPLVAWSTAIHRWALTVATYVKVAPPRREASKNARGPTQVEATRRPAVQAPTPAPQPPAPTPQPRTGIPRRPGSGGFNPRTSGF